MEHLAAILYLLRVPLVGWLLAVALAPLGAWPEAKLETMLFGMFDVTCLGSFWVTLAAALAGATFAACALLILQNGLERAQVSPPKDCWCFRQGPLGKRLGWPLDNVSLLVLPLAGLPVLSLTAGMMQVNRAAWYELLLASGLAVLAFLALGFLAAKAWRSEFAWLQRLIAQLVRFSPAGYLADGKLRPGHGFAVGMTFAFLAVYAVCGLSAYCRLQGPVAAPWAAWLPNPPALALLLILIALLVWLLSAATFFFDRFRIPLLLTIAAYAIGVSSSQKADNHFRVSKAAESSVRLTPADVLAPAGPTPIVVCASGGGIQAGAWAAKVLTELTQMFPERFGASVRLISAVSGGSVGAMYFAADPAHAFIAATSSSLDTAAWGLAYPDLARAFLPVAVPSKLDRGWALEQAWEQNGRGKLPPRLQDWRASVKQGQRPALLLNAIIVETGHRLVFANFDFKGNPCWGKELPKTFADLYHHRFDLPLTTAARLSATFPYVTPVARADADLPQSQRYHFADGGYYDNFGVSSALNFLDLATNGKDGPAPRQVLLIEIRASRSSPSGSLPPASRGQGPLFQFTAPLNGLVNVRDTAQRQRNDADVGLLRDALANRGVKLHNAVFECPRESVPLSWHLTKPQTNDLDTDWTRLKQKEGPITTVRRYLSLTARVVGQ